MCAHRFLNLGIHTVPNHVGSDPSGLPQIVPTLPSLLLPCLGRPAYYYYYAYKTPAWFQGVQYRATRLAVEGMNFFLQCNKHFVGMIV